MIYLDNNATTLMPREVIAAIVKWFNCGNPSSSYQSAEAARQLMNDFKEYIANICRFKLNDWNFIFTSSSTESNSFIINSVVNSYFLHKGRRPHIISSEIEHKSILLALEQVKKYRDIDYTLVKPNKLGFITADRVRAAIKDNTCLITIMAANNETGGIMDISSISAAAHDKGIPFHTDAAQYFAKYSCTFPADVDAFSVSFHKLHGPPGAGLLAIKKSFVEMYDIGPQIYGVQNDGLRGGTENIPAIAGAFAGMKFCISGRKSKDGELLRQKSYLMKLLACTGIPCMSLEDYYNNIGRKRSLLEIVFISGIDPRRWLPNTLLFSIIKNNDPAMEIEAKAANQMCNTEIKRRLAEKGIIVSIGSACNTKSKFASHVLYAIGADARMKRGALRISLGEDIIEKGKKEKDMELRKFVTELSNILKDYNN